MAVRPPSLRTLIRLRGGRLASSDLNMLYARVLHRNRRIQRLMEHDAPQAILAYEKRLLQEACDALFDNARRPHPFTDGSARPLNSLTDVLRGKQGRIRRTLLREEVE